MNGHAGAWLTWYVASLIVASSSVHPLVSLGTITAALTIVAARTTRDDRGPFKIMLLLGIAFIALRVVLFTLTGRAGATTLITLPELRLPALLGGIRIGGALSAEVAANELVEGVRLCAILATTGVFIAVTDVIELVRLAPKRLRRTGIIIQIAVAFIPSLAASIREVGEAQRARGVRVRGLRSAVPMIVPVMAGALDRAFTLSTALHTRGFDRPDPSRAHRAFTRSDRVLLTASIAAAVLAFLAARTPSGAWSPYPILAWPPTELILIAAPMLLMVHLVIGVSDPRRVEAIA